MRSAWVLVLACALALPGCLRSAAVDPAQLGAPSSATTLPLTIVNTTEMRWIKVANSGYVAGQGGQEPTIRFAVPEGAHAIAITIAWTASSAAPSTLTGFVATDGVSYAHARGASPLKLNVDDADAVSRGGTWSVSVWPGDDPITANPQDSTLEWTITLS